MPCPSDGLTPDLDHSQREALHFNVRSLVFPTVSLSLKTETGNQCTTLMS